MILNFEAIVSYISGDMREVNLDSTKPSKLNIACPLNILVI